MLNSVLHQAVAVNSSSQSVAVGGGGREVGQSSGTSKRTRVAERRFALLIFTTGSSKCNSITTVARCRPSRARRTGHGDFHRCCCCCCRRLRQQIYDGIRVRAVEIVPSPRHKQQTNSRRRRRFSARALSSCRHPRGDIASFSGGPARAIRRRVRGLVGLLSALAVCQRRTHSRRAAADTAAL